ncbi:MAG: FlgD immunoglobulin-like domain containing protein [Candidatus Zixiibacteriota bacterium]
MRKLLLIIVILIPSLCLADIHYVSKTGTSEYPYTSWETAADSIMQAMRAADPGDTVMVGAGDYYPDTTIVMKDSVSLIGAGMDSTRIHGSVSIICITLAKGSVVNGFHIIGGHFAVWNEMPLQGSVEVIENNKITNCASAIDLYDVSIAIRNNIILNCGVGVAIAYGFDYHVANNTFFKSNPAVFFGPTQALVVVANNVIDATGETADALDLSFNYDSTFCANNIVYSADRKVYNGIYFSSITGVISNNTVVNFITDGIEAATVGELLVANNISVGNKVGIKIENTLAELPTQLKLLYNNTWANYQADTVIADEVIRDSIAGNISADPMFADSFDFHLQKYSPCIDVGDPSLKDPDSSRSDIGAYGGPLGQSYVYLDLPPKAPDSLEASFDSISITLSWRKNTEADLSHYIVYKDTVFNFEPDTFKIVGIISKDTTFFRDYDWELGKTYYYKVSAYDLTENESSYSEELEITATDVPFSDETTVDINKVRLAQNYPNPFNPTTVIYYYLPDIGYQPAEVEITIYNILGSKVRTLVKERQHPGEYRVTWDGKNDQGKDLASGVYFYQLKVSGIPFVEGKKMVLVR